MPCQADVGARSLGLFSAGDTNVVLVDVEETIESGPRANIQADSIGLWDRRDLNGLTASGSGMSAPKLATTELITKISG
jgi:hypothetical protein